MGDAAEGVTFERRPKNAFDRHLGYEGVGGRPIKESHVPLSDSPRRLTGRPIEKKEVHRRSLPGGRPVHHSAVAFGYRFCDCWGHVGRLRH